MIVQRYISVYSLSPPNKVKLGYVTIERSREVSWTKVYIYAKYNIILYILINK